MTVSAALIVKNEAGTLARCLDSLRGAVDDIVIVDTGSTDATKEIARRYTNRLFDFAWCDNFSAARQFAFEQATSEWVLWVDADDVVRGAQYIRPLVAQAAAEVTGFRWQYIYEQDDWGQPRCTFWRERCVRHDGSWHWHGRIHELLVPNQADSLVINSPDVVVEHWPEPARQASKQQRNLTILEAEAAERPSPRTLFYLGSEYASTNQPEKAITAYQQYLQMADWDDEKYLAHIRLADLHRRQEQYTQAINIALEALKICPHWPDAYFSLAQTYYFLQAWPKVIHWSEMGRAMPLPDTLHIINPMAYRYDWIIYYANALYHIGQTANALAWTEHALTLCPGDTWHQQNFFFFSQRLPAEQPLKEAHTYEYTTA